MKIVALENNFAPSAANLGSMYIMADSAIARNNRPWFLPDFADHFVCHAHLVFRIGRLGKNVARRFAYRYIDAVTVGLSVSAEPCADKVLARTFDGAAVMGDFVTVDQLRSLSDFAGDVAVSDAVVAHYNAHDMIAGIDEIVEHLSKYCTLKTGDVIFGGFGDEATTLAIGQTITGCLDNNEVLKIWIK